MKEKAKSATYKFLALAVLATLSTPSHAIPGEYEQRQAMKRAIEDCYKQVDAVNASINSNAAKRVRDNADDFMRQTKDRIVKTQGTGTTGGSTGGSGDSYSCFKNTQSAFDSILQEISGLFGEWGGIVTSIFGGAGGTTAMALCQEAQEASGQDYNNMEINCPAEYVPGMPAECLSGTYQGSGDIGVYGYRIPAPGASASRVSSRQPTSSSSAYAPSQAPAAAAPSPSQGLVSRFSCWLTNSCN